MSNNLDLQSVVSETVELVKTKWQPMLIASLLYIVTCIPAAIPGINVLFIIFALGPLVAGYLHTINNIRKGQPTKATDIYKGFSSYGKAIGVYLLFSIVVGVGSIFFIVPGIILAVGLFPALFLIVDADYGVMDTLHKAWDMTKGKKMGIFINMLVFTLLLFVVEIVFALVFALLNFIPILGLLIGCILALVLGLAVTLASIGIYSVLYGRLETPEAEIEEPISSTEA